MALTYHDRELLERCLDHDSEAWIEFVDRFMPVIHHVINHTLLTRGILLQPHELEDMAADVLTEYVRQDFAVLRRFRERSSLSTYLAVIARRVAVRKLMQTIPVKVRQQRLEKDPVDNGLPPELRIDNEDEVWEMLKALNGREAEIIRGFYIENKTYKEIAREQGIPENSVGPMLARIRDQLRKSSDNEEVKISG